jgi:membrane protein YqaA with SNARE-associated domain
MNLLALLGLFFSAFIAATLFPAQSELVLVGTLAAKVAPVWVLISVATVGNTLGSTVNWLLGRYFMRFKDRRWFPVKGGSLVRAENWYRKYGRWTLLLSWLPIVGDPLTLVAGLMREPILSFTLIVAFAKLARYLVVAAITLQWVQV